MSGEPEKPGTGGAEKPMTDEPEPEWQRKLRLARIFGDVLPETTEDEREDPRERRDSETWLREQVPPHHGQK